MNMVFLISNQFNTVEYCKIVNLVCYYKNCNNSNNKTFSATELDTLL